MNDIFEFSQTILNLLILRELIRLHKENIKNNISFTRILNILMEMK